MFRKDQKDSGTLRRSEGANVTYESSLAGDGWYWWLAGQVNGWWAPGFSPIGAMVGPVNPLGPLGLRRWIGDEIDRR